MDLDDFFETADAADTLAIFEKSLSSIAKKHAAAPDDRGPVMDAMELMVALVSKRFSEDCARPFAAVYRGFQNLEAGNASGLMKPAQRRGRPVDPVSKNEVKAMVAAVVDELVERHGLGLPDACSKVAGWLANTGVGVARRGHQIPPTAQAVNSWRQTVSAMPRLDRARKRYRAAMAQGNTEVGLRKALRRLIEVVYDR